MQLRFATGLSGEDYVRTEAWRDASLDRCPNHPHGGCSLGPNGTYARKSPRGARVARWYCPESHTTFGLLPDCLAARLPGTLDDLEAVVVAAEEAGSLEEAANAVRRPEDDDAIELPGAMRWVRRRMRLIHDIVSRVIGLIPDRLAGLCGDHGGGSRASRRRRRPDEAARTGLGAAADTALAFGLPGRWPRRDGSHLCLPTLDGA